MRRLAFVAVLFISGSALAQVPGQAPPGSPMPTALVPAPPPPIPDPHAGHAAQGAAPSAAPSGHEGHEPGAHEGDHHAPGKFNFADLPRFTAERDAAAKGDPTVPVTPYAYLLVNFAILLYIYVRMGKKPMMDGLEARRALIAKELLEAAAIKKEASDKLAEYKQKLAELDQELERIRDELIKTGQADRDRLVREAEERAAQMRKDAQFLLDQELKQLRNELLVHTVELATAAAEKALAGKVTAADHERLANEYLESLGKPAGKSASSGGAS